MPTVDLVGRGTVAFEWTAEGPETVVLLNGSVFNYHQWDRQPLPILRRALPGCCRFLQYDYVGVGGSSAKTAPFNMFDLADELCDLLDALSAARVHLLGVSKGSLVSQAFLIRHPERVKSFCGVGNPFLLSNAGLEAAASYRERVEELQNLKELWPQRITKQNHARIFNRVYVPAMFSKPYTDLSLTERLRAIIVRRMAYPALEGTFVQTMVDLFGYYADGIQREAPAYAEGLPNIEGVPILLLNGTSDTTTPIEMSRKLAALLPGAELVEFQGVTHMGPMMLKRESQPIFERYVAFLQGVLRDA